MAAVNSYFAPLQLPLRSLPTCTTAAEQEDFPLNHQRKAEGHLLNSTSGSCSTCGEKSQEPSSPHKHPLKSTKSTESLNSLLRSLPEVVIPETLHNPLPLQCLAASALPEAVREEIDRVLDHYSNAMSSPGRVQDVTTATGGSSSALLNGAERDASNATGEEESSVRGNLAVDKEGLAVQVVIAGEEERDPTGTSEESPLTEVRFLDYYTL